MKTFILLLILANVAAHAQAVLRVNNTPGSAAPYTTIDAAVTAAGPNDIIMVEGSLTNYGGVTITKKVTIVGPGYFLNENPNLQATSLPATIFNIALNSGASGSSIGGLTFLGGSAVAINGVSNVSIINSYFNTGSPGCVGIDISGTGSNIVIAGNYMRPSSCSGAPLINSTGSYTGVLVTNNYIGDGFNTGSTTSMLISNNTFGSVFSINLQNSVVQNNIFVSGSYPINNATGSTLTNNIFSYLTNPLFVGLSGNTTDTQWKLQAASPARGAGVGGADCGMYGGATPYRPSGIGAGQHTITNYVFPATVPKNGVLNVKVSAKVN